MKRHSKIIRKCFIAFTVCCLVAIVVRTTNVGEERAEGEIGFPFAAEHSLGSSGTEVASMIDEAISSSSDPILKAVARGTIRDSRIEETEVPGQWVRILLVDAEFQDRTLRIVESWRVDILEETAELIRSEIFLADQIIVRVKKGVPEQRIRDRLEAGEMSLDGPISTDLFKVRIWNVTLDSVPDAIRYLAGNQEVVVDAEPDGVEFGGGQPNDPRFSEQWGLHNTGQLGGTTDADVDAVELWDIVGGAPGIVVAVLDTGLNFTHPDLLNTGWENPNETAGDGIDNDSNGRTDDIVGWDFVNNDNNPTDDHGHGSNVTGIIAANRNNAVGIAGMASEVKILVCKILNSSNSGLTSDLIAATGYARNHGVPVMNLSLQNYPYSSLLNTEFNNCQAAGITLSICAGNQGSNNDSSPNYPSSYSQTNIIAVGNHSRNDVRWSGSFNPSKYGATRTDLFAPGREILSPVLGTGYSSYTGTSQAAPYVTAVCALIKSINPSWGAPEIKNSILSSVVTNGSFAGLCVSGGRLNALAAVSHALRQFPDQDKDGDGASDLFEYFAGTRIDLKSSQPAVLAEMEDGFLKIGVPRVPRPDARFVVETADDLEDWKTLGVTDFSTPEQLMGGVLITDAPKAFLRIKALPTP